MPIVVSPLSPTGLGLAHHLGTYEATTPRGLWRKQGAVGTTHKSNLDRGDDVSQELPRSALFVRGLVILGGLRDLTCGDIAPLHRRGIGKPRLRGFLNMRGQRRHAFD